MTRVPNRDLKAQYAALRVEMQAALAEVCESAHFTQRPATQAYAAYCMFAADNGIEWAISATPDKRIPTLQE